QRAAAALSGVMRERAMAQGQGRGDARQAAGSPDGGVGIECGVGDDARAGVESQAAAIVGACLVMIECTLVNRRRRLVNVSTASREGCHIPGPPTVAKNRITAAIRVDRAA